MTEIEEINVLKITLYPSVFPTDTEIWHLGRGECAEGSKGRGDRTNGRSQKNFRGINGKHLPETAFYC